MSGIRGIDRLLLQVIRDDSDFAPSDSAQQKALARLIAGGFVRSELTERGEALLAESKRSPVRQLQQSANDERWEYAQSLRDSGSTLQQIGELLGVTRERVRQKTRPGLSAATARRVDPNAVVAALRHPDVKNMAELSKRCGASVDMARRCIVELGLAGATNRLFHWRRTAPKRFRYAAVIRELAAFLGRTPSLSELREPLGIGQPNAVAPHLTNVFGSVRAAMIYCDLEPRPVGGAGHLVRSA